MAYKVIDIANQLLVKAYRASDGELMTNLKLQKMLYYQQGFHLAYFGTPLFDDEIEAWMYGPVVPSVYNHYKGNGRNGIISDNEIKFSFEDRKEIKLMMKYYEPAFLSLGSVTFRKIATNVAITTGDFPKIVVTHAGNAERDADA